MRPGGLLEGRVELGDELVRLLGQPERLPDDRHDLAPRRRPRLLGVDDGRGDLAEDLVLLLGDPGVGREDDVGRERVDVLVGRLLDGRGEDRRLGVDVGEGLVDPGQQPVLVDGVGLGLDPDGDDAEGERRLGRAPAEGDDVGDVAGDLRAAEGVLDGHRRSGARGGAVGGVVVGAARAAGGEGEGHGGREGHRDGASGHCGLLEEVN